MIKLKRLVIQIVLWLTRIAGAVFVIGGIGFFVTAWMDKSLIPVIMGSITIAFGVVIASIHAPTRSKPKSA